MPFVGRAADKYGHRNISLIVSIGLVCEGHEHVKQKAIEAKIRVPGFTATNAPKEKDKGLNDDNEEVVVVEKEVLLKPEKNNILYQKYCGQFLFGL
jgi:hypothetical protein